jgi:two-component system sensor histidine kinase DegS
VAIIGAGRGGTALIEILHKDPLVRIVGVADSDRAAPGLKLCRKLGIPTTNDYHKLLAIDTLDIVMEVTGNKAVERELAAFARPGVAVIEGPSAKFIWQLIEVQIKGKKQVERHLAEYQALYRLYVREMQHTIVEERTRIALDIHDGLVQTLVGVNFKLDLCDEIIATDPAKARQVLQESKALLKTAMEEARHVVFNLKPLHFDRPELVAALKNFLKTYARQYEIATDIAVRGDEARIPTKTKIFLFRIIQEALSNVQKHARAKHVRVRLEIGENDMHVVIQDDGVGFDLKAVSQDPTKWASFGLKGIIERARLLGGEAVYETAPGEGTTIRIRAPLVEKEFDVPQPQQ